MECALVLLFGVTFLVAGFWAKRRQLRKAWWCGLCDCRIQKWDDGVTGYRWWHTDPELKRRIWVPGHIALPTTEDPARRGTH